MVHRRSEHAHQMRVIQEEQKLQAKRLLRDLNFHDDELSEIVHTVNEASIFQLLHKHYGFVSKRVVDLVCGSLKEKERGEVRVDTRGRGSMQQLREDELPLPFLNLTRR